MLQIRDPEWRKRFLVMTFGVVIMGIGIGLFRVSLFGNDPYSAMNMAIGNCTGISFSTANIIVNFLCFILQVIFGRKIGLIGSGTIVNWFGVGILVDLSSKLILKTMPFSNLFPVRVIFMLTGVLVLSFSCALYQEAHLGVSPYDSLALMMESFWKLPFAVCRIITDTACTIVAFLLGGLIGVGTLVCAMGLGPFVSFFRRIVRKSILPQAGAMAR